MLLNWIFRSRLERLLCCGKNNRRRADTMFSIIMPVYNTESYLEEAIESIINQTIFAKGQVHLQLLDDGSRDGSLSICRRYEKMYPELVTVTHFEENQGVSAIRNYGVEQAKGLDDVIVGFMDSDDRMELDTLERVETFFGQHEDVNFAATEIHLFDAVEKPQRLNWRFEQREVVDIKKDYDFPHYYIGGAFVRRSALMNLHFEEKMSFWEDALAVNQVILQEGKYGLVRGAKYYYRKRNDDTSLVSRAWKEESRYTSFLQEGYMTLMDFCKKKKHRVIPYIQFVVAYHLRIFMMNSNSESVGAMMDSPDEMTEFRKRLQKVLRRIKEKIIVRVPTTLPIIEAMLSVRKGRPVRVKKVFTGDDCLFVYKGYTITRMSERNVALFYILRDGSEYDGMWRGRFSTPAYAMKKEDYIFAEHEGQRIRSIEYPCRKQLFILGQRYRCWFHAGFVIDIPKEWESARFGIHVHESGTDILMNEIVFEEIIEQQKTGEREC